MAHKIHGIIVLHPKRCCRRLVCLRAWIKTQPTRLEWWLRTDSGMGYHRIRSLERKTQVTINTEMANASNSKVHKSINQTICLFCKVHIFCQFKSQKDVPAKNSCLRKQAIHLNKTTKANNTGLFISYLSDDIGVCTVWKDWKYKVKKGIKIKNILVLQQHIIQLEVTNLETIK